MTGGAAFWIEGASVDDRQLAARLGAWRDRVTEKYSSFLRVENDDEPPRELMAALSAERQTDVLWVAVQSSIDAFELVHYRNGALLRELVYGYEKEMAWGRVSGARQPWERWSKDPVVGEMHPMPDHADLFEHYGLIDERPAGAKSKAKVAPKAKAKTAPEARAKVVAKAKAKAKVRAKPARK